MTAAALALPNTGVSWEQGALSAESVSRSRPAHTTFVRHLCKWQRVWRTVAGLMMCVGLAGAGGALVVHLTSAPIPSAVFVTWQSGEYRGADQAQYFAGQGRSFALAFDVRNSGRTPLLLRSASLGPPIAPGVVYFDDVRESVNRATAKLPGQDALPVRDFRLGPGEVATISLPVTYDICRYDAGSYFVGGAFITFQHGGSGVAQAIAFRPRAQLVAGVPCH